ncbi:hypothetical protein CUMW_279120, partial [Citrus unshiu]
GTKSKNQKPNISKLVFAFLPRYSGDAKLKRKKEKRLYLREGYFRRVERGGEAMRHLQAAGGGFSAELTLLS